MFSAEELWPTKVDTEELQLNKDFEELTATLINNESLYRWERIAEELDELIGLPEHAIFLDNYEWDGVLTLPYFQLENLIFYDFHGVVKPRINYDLLNFEVSIKPYFVQLLNDIPNLKQWISLKMSPLHQENNDCNRRRSQFLSVLSNYESWVNEVLEKIYNYSFERGLLWEKVVNYEDNPDIIVAIRSYEERYYNTLRLNAHKLRTVYLNLCDFMSKNYS